MINDRDRVRLADAFCIAAQWADSPEGTHPRISKSARIVAGYYASAFIDEHEDLYAAAVAAQGYGEEDFARDLYFTAAGHGTGFWDRKELEVGDVGEKLSDAIRKDFRKWWIEPEFSNGWMFLHVTLENKS